MTQEPPIEYATNGNGDAPHDDSSSLASVVLIDRREDIAGICGRVDTAPTFAVVLHAPAGNRQLATELGVRRLQRHVEEAGKVIAIATPNVALASRARQVGIPVARRPEHVRWDAGGKHVLRLPGRTLTLPKLGRYVQAGIIVAFAAAFIALAFTMAPSATVTAYPPSETLSKTVQITASPDRDDIDFDNLLVPAREVSSVETLTLAVKTTGTVPVGTEPAKVIITITNPGNTDVVLPRDTVLLAGPKFLPFGLDLDTPVPAGKSATQQATARNAGAEYNVPAGTVTGWLDEKYRTLELTNPEPAAGGADESRPGVDPRDLAAIRQLAQSLQNSDAGRQLLISERPHDAVFLRTAKTSVDFTDPETPVGSPADVLLMKVDVKVTAYAVLEGTLNEIAQHVLKLDQGVGEFIPGSVRAIETGARQIDAKTNTIKTEVKLQGEFARNVTRDSIRSAVEGKSTSSAKSTLASQYGIQDSKVSVSPGWMPWLPRFGFRIAVDLRSKTAEDATIAGDATPNAAEPSPTPAPTATAGP